MAYLCAFCPQAFYIAVFLLLALENMFCDVNFTVSTVL